MRFAKSQIIFLLIGLLCTFCGGMFFLIQREWLIVQFTLGGSGHLDSATGMRKDVVMRKQVKFYCIKD